METNLTTNYERETKVKGGRKHGYLTETFTKVDEATETSWRKLEVGRRDEGCRSQGSKDWSRTVVEQSRRCRYSDSADSRGSSGKTKQGRAPWEGQIGPLKESEREAEEAK